MGKPRPVDAIAVAGFKSIRDVQLELRGLNVIIGANGSGKSNLVALFRLLARLVDGGLQHAIGRGGGPEAFLHFGSKVTSKIVVYFRFGSNGYGFRLEPTVQNQLLFANEATFWAGNFWPVPPEDQLQSIGRGHLESKLREAFDADRAAGGRGVVSFVYPSVKSWTVYHFHDTSESAPIKQRQNVRDTQRLAPDGANLAPMLLWLRSYSPPTYETLRGAVRLAAPLFDDFDVDPLLENDSQTELRWRQAGSEYRFHGSQLSDGTLRFMCLAMALLQPFPPSTLVIDEPELGLHPYALVLLASLVKQASKRTQVILCTQSPQLLSEFELEDVVVAAHEAGASRFDRPDPAALRAWLDEYSLGELWQKNLLGGRPGR